MPTNGFFLMFPLPPIKLFLLLSHTRMRSPPTSGRYEVTQLRGLRTDLRSWKVMASLGDLQRVKMGRGVSALFREVEQKY